MKTEDKTS